jgi:hypothetical protein
VGKVEDVRFVDPDVAVLHAVGGTIMRGKSKPSPGRDSIQTLTVTRGGHEWQVAAFQNTRLRLMGPGRAFVVDLSDMVWRVFRLNQPSSAKAARG